MFRFLFITVFAVMGGLNLTTGMRGFPFGTLPSPRSLDFREICKLFCGGQSDYHDYDYFFRTVDHLAEPRIFCGICHKKYSTTTTTTTTSTSTSTSTTTTTTTKKPNSTDTTPQPPSNLMANLPHSNDMANPPPSKPADAASTTTTTTTTTPAPTTTTSSEPSDVTTTTVEPKSDSE